MAPAALELEELGLLVAPEEIEAAALEAELSRELTAPETELRAEESWLLTLLRADVADAPAPPETEVKRVVEPMVVTDPPDSVETMAEVVKAELEPEPPAPPAPNIVVDPMVVTAPPDSVETIAEVVIAELEPPEPDPSPPAPPAPKIVVDPMVVTAPPDSVETMADVVMAELEPEPEPEPDPPTSVVTVAVVEGDVTTVVEVAVETAEPPVAAAQNCWPYAMTVDAISAPQACKEQSRTP